jgi:DNA-binding LacI/PurR family transcriptional regulator
MALPKMVSNISRQATDSSYRLTLGTVQNLQLEEVKAALDELHGRLIDGIIMIVPIAADFMEEIKEFVGNIPFVQIDTRPQTGIASVAIDQAFGSKLATEHLINLGHHHIAEISGPLNWHDAVQRHQSWLDTMQSYQLLVEMSVEGNWTAQSGYEAVHELVKTKAKFTVS